MKTHCKTKIGLPTLNKFVSKVHDLSKSPRVKNCRSNETCWNVRIVTFATILLVSASSNAQQNEKVIIAVDPPQGASQLTSSEGVPIDPIADSEYEIHWQQSVGAFMAPNRAQNFRFTFMNDGFTVVPRKLKAGDLPWRATFKVLSYGKSDQTFESIGIATLAVRTNNAEAATDRIAIRYKNDRHGLRQDFLVMHQPYGEGPLRITFSIETSLIEPILDDAGSMISFACSTSGPPVVVRYTSLRVFDANNRQLDAKMARLNRNNFAIFVNDYGARYPILVDPSLQSDGYEASPGGSFGYSVAWFRNVGFVPSAGPMPMGGIGDYGGLLVGAPNWDDGNLADCGKVFYYDMSSTYGTTLPTTPTWTYTGTQNYEHVGCSVADAGYVKYATAKYHAILVGAWGHTGTYSQEGAAFAFYRNDNAVFSATPDWTALGGQAYANLGWSVAGVGEVNGVVDPINGERYSDIVVGAPSYSNNGYSYNGKAQLYTGSHDHISLSPAWTGYGVGSYAQFGTSVAGGNVNGQNYQDVIIGAPGNYSSSAGAAYIYTTDANGNLGLATTLLGQAVGDQFGASVASGFDVDANGNDDVLVGAPDASFNGHPQCGKAYLYAGNSGGVDPTPRWITAGDRDYMYWGKSVAAGKMDGDSFADVIIGAPGWSSGTLLWAGRVSLFLTDPATGWPGTACYTDWGIQAGLQLGTSMAYGPYLVYGRPNMIGGAPGAPPGYAAVRVWRLDP